MILGPNSRLAAFVLLFAAYAAVHADERFPSRPLRIVQGFSAGGISDTLARIVGDKLERQFNQPVVVETRSGGGGVVGMQAVMDATPDGYTLLLGNSAITISANRKQKLPFDPMKEFVPVSMIGTAPSILLANPALRVSSVSELIAYAKSHDGKVDCATSGVGTSNDLAVHLLNQMAHIKIMKVPYKGSGPSLTAAISNETPLSFAPVLAAISHVKQGRLKPLGVSSLKRNRAFPDVPAIAESVPGYEDVGFYSIVAPREVPRARLDLLHREINSSLALPDVRERLASLGLDVAIMSRDQFGEFMVSDAHKWRGLVSVAHLSL
ncbi:MAG: tripartite tricarboxylate transporter substrate binding protein [Burkholderiales bacterium]